MPYSWENFHFRGSNGNRLLESSADNNGHRLPGWPCSISHGSSFSLYHVYFLIRYRGRLGFLVATAVTMLKTQRARKFVTSLIMFTRNPIETLVGTTFYICMRIAGCSAPEPLCTRTLRTMRMRSELTRQSLLVLYGQVLPESPFAGQQCFTVPSPDRGSQRQPHVRFPCLLSYHVLS